MLAQGLFVFSGFGFYTILILWRRLMNANTTPETDAQLTLFLSLIVYLKSFAAQIYDTFLTQKSIFDIFLTITTIYQLYAKR